jgi:hypothetical protein
MSDDTWTCPTCPRVFSVGTRIRATQSGGMCAACYERKRREATRPPRHKQHRCQACDGIFTATRADALYCSARCRQNAHRERVFSAESDARIAAILAARDREEDDGG